MSGVFLCHSSADKLFVRNLALRLAQRGLNVWLDEAELNIGDSLIQRIAEGIYDVDFVVAVISTNSVASSWVQKELHLAMTREIEGRRVVVLPLLIERCKLPVFLRDKLYGDFTKPERFETELARLIHAVEFQPQVHSISNHTGENYIRYSYPGDPDLGAIIHDKGQSFWAFRTTKRNWVSGVVLAITGLIAMSLGMVLNIPVLGTVSGFLLAIGGLGLSIASSLSNKSFDFDRNLVVALEDVGGYILPFGKVWRRQWRLGARNRMYRTALSVETGSLFLLFLSVLILASALVTAVAA